MRVAARRVSARGPEVGLGRGDRVPVGGRGHAAGVDLAERSLDAELLLDRTLDRVVSPLAEVVEPQTSTSVDEIERRPVAVRERLPDREVVVDDHGVGNAELRYRAADVVEIVLEAELRRMHAHDDEPVGRVALVPRPPIRQRPQPVDAGVRAEVDGDGAPDQPARRQRIGVEPARRLVERRERALGGWGGRHRLTKPDRLGG